MVSCLVSPGSDGLGRLHLEAPLDLAGSHGRVLEGQGVLVTNLGHLHRGLAVVGRLDLDGEAVGAPGRTSPWPARW